MKLASFLLSCLVVAPTPVYGALNFDTDAGQTALINGNTGVCWTGSYMFKEGPCTGAADQEFSIVKSPYYDMAEIMRYFLLKSVSAPTKCLGVAYDYAFSGTNQYYITSVDCPTDGNYAMGNVVGWQVDNEGHLYDHQKYHKEYLKLCLENHESYGSKVGMVTESCGTPYVTVPLEMADEVGKEVQSGKSLDQIEVGATPQTATPTVSPTHATTSVSPTFGIGFDIVDLVDTVDVAITSPPGGPKQGSSHGDPHFKTFGGSRYDFHGGCDLVLFRNKKFANGLGMAVHIRTKINTWWSYIASAVLRVGTNTLEVMGGAKGGQFWVNGKEQKEPNDGDVLSLSGLQVSFHRVSNKQLRFRLDFGRGDAIALETFKDFVSVNIRAKTDQFKSSVGLLGSFPEGEMLARDGVTFLEDPIAFGKEWQVLKSESMLFHSLEGPQHPQVCAMPDEKPTKTTRRRLGEAFITEEDAVVACAHANEDDKDACIFDVMATNDKEMAGTY